MKNIFVNIYLFFGILSISFSQNFESHEVYGDIIGPAGICCADINNNGFLDVVASAWDGHTIELYKNNGLWPLSWSHETVAQEFGGASYVVVGDIDLDGIPDIIGSAFYDNELAWFKYENGAWVKYPVTSAFLQAHEVNICDVDLDGDLDVLGAAAESNEISWFENTGIYNEEWPKHLVDNHSMGARSVDANDIDGDGDIDIASASLSDNAIVWYRNNGGNPIEFTKITINSSFTYSHKVQIIDMNQDGHLDLLGTAYQNGIKWWENDGADSISWDMHFVSNFSTAVIAKGADIDNDGDIDILGTSQGTGRVARWINIGDNTMNWNYQVIETFSGAWPLDPGDIDNDGDIDFVVGGFNLNQIRWYENDFIMEETVTDYDGNEYQTVDIGDQTWLKQNIKSLHYADGTEISEVWSYEDNEEYANIYGRLYTWDGAMKYNTVEGSQGVCPNDWHVPTDDEWSALGNYLGGDAIAGGKMKISGTNWWQAPNTDATNESGFSGLPSGEYDYNHYQYLGMYLVMWSSTETNSEWCKYRALSYQDSELHTNNFRKNFRYSVRCIKDQTIGVENIQKDQIYFNISPNPVKNSLRIEFDKTIEHIEILSISGVRLQNINPLQKNIDVSSLPSGLYILQIISEEGIFQKKFIKK